MKTICGKYNSSNSPLMDRCQSATFIHCLFFWVAFCLLNISILKQLPLPYPDGEWVIKRSIITRKPKPELMSPHYRRAPGIHDEHTSVHRALWCAELDGTWNSSVPIPPSTKVSRMFLTGTPIRRRRWWVTAHHSKQFQDYSPLPISSPGKEI